MSTSAARAVFTAAILSTALTASVLTMSNASALAGDPVAAGAYAYSAKLVIGEGDTQRACSGTLVDPQWVLTAASCFADTPGMAVAAGPPKLSTTVTVGRTDLSTSAGAVTTVTELVPRADRDVVMAKLAHRVLDVAPARIAATAPSPGEQLRATGFGRTKDEWVPDLLHSSLFSVQSVSGSDVALAAGSQGAVICKGDAGGPLVREQGGSVEVAAVNSRSWQGGCLGTADTETRTDAVSSRVDDLGSWIKDTVFVAPGDLTGDDKPDLVAVDGAGNLRLYPGDGKGGLGSYVVIGTGGWSGASVTHRGDWTGDGLEDVVAIVGGELRVYPNRGDGSLAAPIKVASGLPTSSKVVGIGDATGDGRPDLVISHDDKLWLYAEGTGATPSVAAPVLIGSGGWTPMTITAPGDANRDGRVDLLARDTRTGDLWLYPGKAGGGFGTRTQYGHSYSTTIRPLLAGAADADGNGVADMWATTNDGTGTLLFYAGATDSTGNPVDGPRTTVGTGGWSGIQSIS
ncbi:FG-GAP-like repeat-containing protein [Streptacidiphilus rugosus]|uniref:FG-GAP-like repeat-containing protein n=1 Tax=Streptacidiphilus rugosus TaxID=405783 RepID=UPI000A05638D|nr:FG-GAP-like repeat-containing protein [Streptacidiphilus rugosus]